MACYDYSLLGLNSLGKNQHTVFYDDMYFMNSHSKYETQKQEKPDCTILGQKLISEETYQNLCLYCADLSKHKRYLETSV